MFTIEDKNEMEPQSNDNYIKSNGESTDISTDSPSQPSPVFQQKNKEDLEKFFKEDERYKKVRYSKKKFSDLLKGEWSWMSTIPGVLDVFKSKLTETKWESLPEIIPFKDFMRLDESYSYVRSLYKFTDVDREGGVDALKKVYPIDECFSDYLFDLDKAKLTSNFTPEEIKFGIEKFYKENIRLSSEYLKPSVIKQFVDNSGKDLSYLLKIFELSDLHQHYSLNDFIKVVPLHDLLPLYSKEEFIKENITEDDINKELEKIKEEEKAINLDGSVFKNSNCSNQSLPRSLQKFEGHLKNYLEGVKFFDFKDIDDKCEKTMKKMLLNEPFRLKIHTENLLKVLGEGRFKNLLETGTSGGYTDKERRKQNTEKLFGADIANMEAKEHPKFGYLGTMALSCDHYGDVIVTLKKENLWNRTTFTAHDSLMYENYLKPSPVSNPNLASFYWKNDKLKLSAACDLYNKNGFDTFRKFMETSYIELQYHGDLLATDIEEIEFTEPIEPDLQEILKDKLQDLKIPYKYS